MSKVHIAVRNHSSVLTDKEVIAKLPAFQRQVSYDFAPHWGADAQLDFVAKGAAAPSGSWLLCLIDDADQAGALGYHDLTVEGCPLGKVFVKTTQQYGGLWTVTFSHELLEMLGDPNINLCAMDDAKGRLYAYEACDAVEADEFGYQIYGTTVSDFVLPGWFDPNHVSKGEKFAFHNNVSAPLQLLPGGYIGYLDMNESSGWQQLTASAVTNARYRTAHYCGPVAGSRAHVGSRRERRRTPRSQWQRSVL